MKKFLVSSVLLSRQKLCSLRCLLENRNNNKNVFILKRFLTTDKVLVVTKLSRYDFEKRKFISNHLNLKKENKNVVNNDKQYDKEFLEYLKQLKNQSIDGQEEDVEKLIYYHDLHKRYEDNMVNTLKVIGSNVKVVNRYNYEESDVNNADIIVPIGGDGTFLLAASLVRDSNKPVVGFNSDPNRSEGYLCLPKDFSNNVADAFERLRTDNFKWLLRSRIRTTLLINSDKTSAVQPNYLHDVDNDDVRYVKTENNLLDSEMNKNQVVLPYLALNEVFLGETLSARVSHLRMKLFNDYTTTTTNLKCSGILVSTGTGSTSWHLSMNRLQTRNVAELLRLLEIDATEGKDSLATVLAKLYNKNLIFASDDTRMSYTIRELISAAVWPNPKGIKPRDFASKLEIKSNCFDASLVIDGGVSYRFENGTVAILEILPEDRLRTVSFC